MYPPYISFTESRLPFSPVSAAKIAVFKAVFLRSLVLKNVVFSGVMIHLIFMSIVQHLNESIISLYCDGCSGREVAEKLNCSLKKVYRTLDQYDIKRRSGSERNALSFSKRPLTYSLKKSLSPNEETLRNAALMLYLGEGAKTGTTVDFTNSNPNAVKIFTRFLREICNVDDDKLRVYLYCFSSQNRQEIMRFWSKFLNIPSSQFTKPYISPSKSSRRVLKYGIVHVRYNDKRLLKKILSLYQQLARSLVSPAKNDA